MTHSLAWKRVWSRAVVQAQVAGDRHGEEALHALGGLTRALTEGVDGGDDLRQHFAEMLGQEGLGATLAAARSAYAQLCQPMAEEAL